jgi:eukaryotic-like serine/threonine-protein kinase
VNDRRCPRCGSVYAHEARFCARDGNMLAEVQAPPKVVDRAASLSGQLLDSRYQVLKKLGEGGMSYVYLAQEVATGQEVAIKVLSPKVASEKSSVARLRREAGLAMRLDHPNVCRIMRLGESEDRLIYLVMPFLKGEPLSDREVQTGPMEISAGIAILRQVCAGLHHAHELQIIHRDLKPENIMLVTEDGRPERAVVMDFGLAKERRAGPELERLTATGIVLGTPEFMSPEQLRGKDLDGRSDVYSLALITVEMLTGSLPFVGKSQQEVMMARLRNEPTPLRKLRPDLGLPGSVERVLLKALARDPDERYPSAPEFAAALLAASRSGPVGNTAQVLKKWLG